MASLKEVKVQTVGAAGSPCPKSKEHTENKIRNNAHSEHHWE
jgi:hypothetical protein